MTPAERRRPPIRPPIRMAARSLLLAGTVLTLAGAGLAGTLPAAAAPAGSAAAAGTASTVLLPTGDLVALHAGTDGRQTASVRPRDRHGVAGMFHTELRGGDVIVYPVATAPYLGRLLDPALFNASQLARAARAAAGTPAAGRIPVRLTWAAGAAHHTVPGITVTGGQGSTSDGYLDARSAAAFGAALTAQIKADAANHWAIGGGIFAGLTGIRFAGPVTPPAAQPRFPMFTLRMLVTGADGQPAPFGFLTAVNTDDVRKTNSFPVIDQGEARISLPTGHYSFLVQTVDFVGDLAVIRSVVVSDYQLSRAQTLSVDLRAATLDTSVQTPRPATTTDGDLAWVRGDALGASIETLNPISIPSFGQQALYAPSQPVRFGVSHVGTRFRLDSPADAAAPYTYDLRFDSGSNIPASLAFRATPAQLATLNVRYHADGPRVEPLTTRFSFPPWLDFGFQALLPVTAPGERTEYVTGAPDVSYQAEYMGVFFDDFSDPDNELFVIGDDFRDAVRSYPAGSQQTVDWDGPIAHPGIGIDGKPGGSLPFLCEACRQGDQLGILLTPVIDNDPGHSASLDFVFGSMPGLNETARTRLYRDGQLISDEQDAAGVLTTVPAADAGYRLVYDQTRIAPWYTQGIRSTTEYTFRSGHTAGATLPSNWFCADGTATACAAVPVLTAHYTVPVNLANTAAPGAQHVHLAVSTVQGAPAVPVTAVTLDVSTDDGATWTPATVTGSAGSYDASFTVPAGGFVSTRLHATDSAGNTITQTVVRAYAIGAAA